MYILIYEGEDAAKRPQVHNIHIYYSDAAAANTKCVCIWYIGAKVPRGAFALRQKWSVKSGQRLSRAPRRSFLYTRCNRRFFVTRLSAALILLYATNARIVFIWQTYISPDKPAAAYYILLLAFIIATFHIIIYSTPGYRCIGRIKCSMINWHSKVEYISLEFLVHIDALFGKNKDIIHACINA